MKRVDEKKARTLGERLDAALAVVSPGLGLKRAQARRAREAILQASVAHRGADRSRLNTNWKITNGSADEDLLPDLPTLRERSRELNRNDGAGSGITGTITTNVVGDGIVPQSRINNEAIGISREEADEFQARAEAGFMEWAEDATADGAERADFFDLQALVERKKIEDGDVVALPLMINDESRRLSLAIEVVESDRLDTPAGERSSKDIRAGVRVGDRGQPVEYFILGEHPGDLRVGQGGARRFTDGKWIKARDSDTGRKNVFHIYDVLRPQQTRGRPLFAPVLHLFRDLSDYLESELVSARVAACFSAFVKKNDPTAAIAANTASTQSDGGRVESFEPGMIEYLFPGESVEFANPNKPGGNFDPFVTRILRQIATGINFSYELVARDYSQVNFSSARAAILEDQRAFRVRQKRNVRQFSQLVWEMVLEEMFLRGEFGPIDFMENRTAYTRAKWNPPGWRWVDPLKEVKAAESALLNNLTTLSDELSQQGKDWEEVLRQRGREEALRKELELPDPAGDGTQMSVEDGEGGQMQFGGSPVSLPFIIGRG